MMAPALKLFFDGGCRPNPGRMEAAVVARGMTHHLADMGTGTNSEAEWLALLHALEVARTIGARSVVLIGDSATVIAQARGVQRCRSDVLRRHHERFRVLAAEFDDIRLRHVRRAQNLAGTALEKSHGRR